MSQRCALCHSPTYSATYLNSKTKEVVREDRICTNWRCNYRETVRKKMEETKDERERQKQVT